MEVKKFWNWEHVVNNDELIERILYLNGTIAEESWLDDEITPTVFKNELNSGTGDITVWINSYGGDCIAAAQIYNMLLEYKGKVTVKIDGIAASAASVIAMAGDSVLMSPVSTIMIHNPLTIVCGDHKDMQKAINMLNEIKESIINAYQHKTGLPRKELSKLMESETWMNANKAIDLGFADGYTVNMDNIKKCETSTEIYKDLDYRSQALNIPILFSQKTVNKALINKISEKYKIKDIEQTKARPVEKEEHFVSDIMKHLNVIKKYI